MGEWFAKTAGLIIIGYMLLFGFPTLAKSDLAYEIGNDPEKIVERVNIDVPATRRNCKDVSKYVYEIMYRCGYSELKLIGVWTITRGHMFITYKNNWGDTMIITTSRKKGIWKTVLIRSENIDSFCDKWDPNWTHYFVYKRNGKVFTKRIR